MPILNNAYIFLLGRKLTNFRGQFSIKYQTSLKCKYSLTPQFCFISFLLRKLTEMYAKIQPQEH